MKLQTKLIIAFTLMLALVAGTAASSWYAMRDMDRMAKQLASVDNAMFAMQRAQVSILRFMTYKNKEYSASAIEESKSSVAYMTNAITYVNNPAQKARTDEALKGAKKYSEHLAALITNTEKSATLTEQMAALSVDVARNSSETLASLSTSIKENYSEQAFNAFYLVNQVDSSFYYTRLRVAQFMANPTPKAAEQAQQIMAHARTQALEAEKYLSLEVNKVAVRDLIKDMDGYTARLAEAITVATDTNKTLLVVRDQGSDVARLCREASDAAEMLIAQSQATGNTTNMVALLIAFLVGVGITIGLTRNINRQLGKDPGELATIATRVTNGDYNIDDGSPRMGVYDNIINMVAALKTNIENALQASEQAKQESARATEAMKSADAASKDAQAKRDSILVAADKLEEVANVVSSAAEELSAQIEQSERGAAEQAARVGETATAMEEMNSTVLEVARNAADANTGGKAMREKALEGAAVVKSSVEGVQKARADALALKEDMNVLSEQAQSIGQIMNVISDIADQTNLLALNAAIEAARAGEAGRGFAVVADEVRKLAEKTMQSTTDVGNAIKSIQASTAKNMAQVDATVKNIEISTEHAEKSGIALREIVEIVDTAVQQVGSIATASEEQSATSEEINRSITHVSTIAAETARAMQEAAQAVSDLSNQAQVLTRLIEDMKKD